MHINHHYVDIAEHSYKISMSKVQERWILFSYRPVTGASSSSFQKNWALKPVPFSDRKLSQVYSAIH
jgi:hypothetical protein